MLGNVVGSFDSLADAEKATGVSKGNICENIKGRRNHAGGFKWSYTGGVENEQ